jgi:hypothetical protein
MVPDSKLGESDLHLFCISLRDLLRHAPMKLFLFLILFGQLSAIGVTADTVIKTLPAAEAPLTITSGYGINGLVLWLSADSGVTLDKNNSGGVAVLADKTGNFILTPNNADQEPAYISNGLNGKPVLQFNPDQALYSDDDFGKTLNRDMTMIVVAMTHASRTFFQYPVYLGQNRTSHANRALAYYEGKEIFDGQWVGFYGPPVVRNSFVMVGASVNPNLTKATFYLNGAQTMTSNLSNENGKASFENLSRGVTLGAAADPCRGWLGDIAEVLVFDRQLSTAEMQIVWSSLSGKYGLQPGAPLTSNP